MKLSCSVEYGIRGLVHLAENAENRPYSLSEIAEKEGISFSFLEKIFAKLRNAGIVEAKKGAHGGYMLARPLDKISMKEVIEAIDGSIAPFQSLIEQGRSPKLHCKSHFVLALVQQDMISSLSEVSLSDIVQLEVKSI